MPHNPNCDGDHCRSESGLVRVLPLDKLPNGANLILCEACFYHERKWRRERNKELSQDVWYDLPEWHTLKVYNPE